MTLNDLNECMNQTRDTINKLIDNNNTLNQYESLQKEYISKYGHESSSFTTIVSIHESIREKHKQELIAKLKNLKIMTDICLNGLHNDYKTFDS